MVLHQQVPQDLQDLEVQKIMVKTLVVEGVLALEENQVQVLALVQQQEETGGLEVEVMGTLDPGLVSKMT